MHKVSASSTENKIDGQASSQASKASSEKGRARSHTSLSVLERQVRNAELPDDPQILKYYLESLEQLAREESMEGQKRFHLRAYSTLVEVICDSFLPFHWRCLCLENVYRPLLAFASLHGGDVERVQLFRMKNEVRVLGQYFFGSQKCS